ncbi:MAG: nitrilase-related carbon-nitrogen hydrolase, partial [Ruthenibacterium sp.]
FLDPAAVKVAAVPIKLRPYKKLEDFVEHMSEKIALAVHSGAQLVVLPELLGLAPLTMVPKYSRILSDYKACPSGDRGQFANDVLYSYFDFLQEVYFTTFSELACQYGIYLLAGSLYLFEGDALFNRAYLFDPDGDIVGYQDKTHLTEAEAALGVTPGTALTLLETKLGKLCIAIGQDNCYFEVYRIAKGLGAQLMLCPVCTLNFGCRYSGMADAYLRVQETALYAVKACMTGDILQQRFGGASGVYCPACIAEEKQGVLAGGEVDGEIPAYCRVNLTKIDALYAPCASDENPAFLEAFAARHYGSATQPVAVD